MSISKKWRADAWYIPILALAMGLMMLRPLMMARIFDTAGFAIYGAGLLVSSTFCMFGCLGLQPMLQRKMPADFFNGKEIASLVLLLQGIIVAVFCAFVVSSVGLMDFQIAGLTPKSFLISLLHGLSQQVFILATVESRSRGEPLRFSFQNLIRAVVVVFFAGVVGLYTRSPAAALFVEASLSLLVSWRILAIVLSGRQVIPTKLFQLAFRRLPRIRWRDALALMAVMLIGFGLTSIDRWFAASWLTVDEFAQYVFAWILLTASQSFQSIVNSSVYPSLARRLASDSRRSSFRLAAKVSFLFLSIGFILMWPACYIFSYIISVWFAEYSSALLLIPIFLVIAVVRLSDFWTSYLIIVGKERLLLVVNVAAGVIVFIVWLNAFWLDLGGNGSALKLAWLALALTISNYICVSCTAIRFRN
ncbi:lipopolysaccharide biosynthesis protein [Marinobacter sediminicola]|uniref:lipopolysaccharide biosynthesis protein n=1 Tax=Marinobacter sediminicola TaxID=3072994 RepID=UPI002811B9FB|nr:hypothetical protein [Marinobacter sp. F26243]